MLQRLMALFLVLSVVSPANAGAQDDAPVSFDAIVAGLAEHAGFLTIYADEADGRVLLALPAPDPDTDISASAIHIAYLATGLGSNPVGLDRGRNSGPSVVHFEVRGGKANVVVENTRFVARSDNAYERAATAESFARSTIWSGDIEALADDGRVLVDISSFLTTDFVGVAQRLGDAGQGVFSLDAGRSAPDASAVHAFPDNVELESVLTFTSKEPGSEVEATAATASAPTFTVHHSFVRLPEPGFHARAFDPRMGVIGLPTADYAAALDEPIARVTTLRFRLEKTDPAAERSPAVKPIVFYVDRGAPPEVRDALIEGASWWSEAFEAAGFDDGFRVELLPEGVDPLDARYNVIQWVHRQTRGWSYGSPIYDPRTGEIIKAVITLGSLRVRHDRRIFEGLLDASRTGSGEADDPIQIALARLRQLSAHEVGHGLGFPHNFAASVNDRASVMDYPSPKAVLNEAGEIDLSDAYASGIGVWDIATTRYLYSQFPEGADEAAALEVIIDEAQEAGLLFIADPDARGLGTANPDGALWDNGEDAVTSLENALAVRAAALSDFGPDNVPAGAPLSELREVITPIHLWHRYAVDRAAKEVGGYRFVYDTSTAEAPTVEPTPADRQRQALDVLLEAASVDTVTVPPEVLQWMGPVHNSWFSVPAREAIAGHTGAIYDEHAAAAAAAGFVFDALLAPERLSRLAAPSGADALTLEEMLDRLSRQIESELSGEERRRATAHAVAERYVTRLIASAATDELSPAVASRVEHHMVGLATRLERSGRRDALHAALARRLQRYVDRGDEEGEVASPPASPPGSPIGEGPFQSESVWHDNQGRF